MEVNPSVEEWRLLTKTTANEVSVLTKRMVSIEVQLQRVKPEPMQISILNLVVRAALQSMVFATVVVSTTSLAQETSAKPLPALPSTTGDWYLTVSPYMHHWYPKPEHRHVWLLGVERYDPDNSVMGFAYFSNSYGDPTVYAYPFGQSYPNFLGVEKLTAKWSAGLLYGYVGQWKDKVPFNHNGFSPGVIPALSWKLPNDYEFQVALPSFNLMFQLQVPLKHFSQ